MTTRKLQRVIPSIPASDGAGVKLRRSLGASQLQRHDPFLMLDEFFSDNPDDYLAGFPAHPHRGFETVTYMLDGHMQHKDNHGNTGDLGPGDVQWMSAARGIVALGDAAAERRPHARLPALAQPAGEGKDEAGGVSGYPVK
jgi:redox-sensitive bicupin YhaK (pirin superfamily)